MIKCKKCGNTDLQKTEQFNETTKRLELFIICKPCRDMSVVDTSIEADPRYLDAVGKLPDVKDAQNPFDLPWVNKIHSWQPITIGQVQTALGYNERAIRKLLNSAGAEIDEYATNPEETIPRAVVVDLWTIRAGMREARKLSPLLESTRPSANP